MNEVEILFDSHELAEDREKKDLERLIELVKTFGNVTDRNEALLLLKVILIHSRKSHWGIYMYKSHPNGKATLNVLLNAKNVIDFRFDWKELWSDEAFWKIENGEKVGVED